MATNNTEKISKEELHGIININPGARLYFYAKADERWLDWLWQNNFLEVIKKKTDDFASYRYGIPELEYLVRMADKAPEKVVDIMAKVPISTETFNPEVISRFVHICRTLPAVQLARVVTKIRDEKWILLMREYVQSGFVYEEMFKTLADTNDYESLLTLAEAVLTMRPIEEITEAPFYWFTNQLFCFGSELSDTKIFEYLPRVDAEYVERALDLATEVIAHVADLWNRSDKVGNDNSGIATSCLDLSTSRDREDEVEQVVMETSASYTGVSTLSGRDDKDQVFKVGDDYLLYDSDFFELEEGQEGYRSSESDMRELVMVVKTLAQRLIVEQCNKPEAVRAVYDKYFGDFDEPGARLPDSQAMWRLRLFVLSLCPKAFKDKLRKAFFRLFDVKHTSAVMNGTEYLKTLRKGFSVLSRTDKQYFVKRATEFFGQTQGGGNGQNLSPGSQIFSIIVPYLDENPELKTRVREAGFILTPGYNPQPAIRLIKDFELVRPRAPLTQQEFRKIPVNELTEKIRLQWAPEELARQNSGKDFLNSLNAEGVGQLLRTDIPARLWEYTSHACDFFERGVLDQHYTCSFLQGVEEALKGNSEVASKVDWDGIIALCIAVKTSAKEQPFRHRRRYTGGLIGWDEVHSAMANVLQQFLNRMPTEVGKYREQILGVLRYLLAYPDPSPEDEQLETTVLKTKAAGDKGYTLSDPFNMAINTVRGRAFDALVAFVYQDDKQFKVENTVRIASDVKEVYECALKLESTRAIMFLFGYYLPGFYFRDRNWVRELLPHLFPQDTTKKALYTAAWEGYLVSSLYGEMFFDSEIQKLYERGLVLRDEDYPRQEHFKKPDRGLAEHLAIAFIHYKEFGRGCRLFDTFWEKSEPGSQADFVSFLGRSVFGDNADADALLKIEPALGNRLLGLWDWLLEYVKSQEVFVGFWLWLDLDRGVFKPAQLTERVKKTLEKIEEPRGWQRGLAELIVRLAREAPKDTLEIVRQYLLKSSVVSNERRWLWQLEDEWITAFQILYSTSETRSETYKLINDLIQNGGSTFWCLKSIVDNNEL